MFDKLISVLTADYDEIADDCDDFQVFYDVFKQFDYTLFNKFCTVYDNHMANILEEEQAVVVDYEYEMERLHNEITQLQQQLVANNQPKQPVDIKYSDITDDPTLESNYVYNINCSFDDFKYFVDNKRVSESGICNYFDQHCKKLTYEQFKWFSKRVGTPYIMDFFQQSPNITIEHVMDYRNTNPSNNIFSIEYLINPICQPSDVITLINDTMNTHYAGKYLKHNPNCTLDVVKYLMEHNIVNKTNICSYISNPNCTLDDYKWLVDNELVDENIAAIRFIKNNSNRIVF